VSKTVLAEWVRERVGATLHELEVLAMELQLNRNLTGYSTKQGLDRADLELFIRVRHFSLRSHVRKSSSLYFLAQHV
jgi:hypothetical protein